MCIWAVMDGNCRSCHLPNVTDDLDIAPDFFSYFSATKWLLDSDPTIWCVSAWNDNGKDGYVSGSGECVRMEVDSHKLVACTSCDMKAVRCEHRLEWLY